MGAGEMMKKELMISGLIMFFSGVFFMNAMVQIDYNLNLMEYISMSADFSERERDILESYGTLTYGGNITEPPLGKYYEDTGQYLGLVTDMIYALAIELETDIVMQPLVWDEALLALKDGTIDLCDLTPSDQREKYYAFTDRIYDLNGVALINAGLSEELSTLTDLSGMKVGVQRGDYVIESLDEQGIFPDYIYADNLTSAMQLLESGAVDVIVGDEPVIKNHLNDARNVNRYEILPDKIYESYVVLGMPKTHRELLPIINKAIFRMKKSGVLQKIQGKWLGTDTAADERRMNEKMKSAGIILTIMFGLLIYLIYAWNRNLKKLVDERTQEIRRITDELEVILANIRATIFLVDERGNIRKLKGALPSDWRAENMGRIDSNDNPALVSAMNEAGEKILGLPLYRVENQNMFDFNYLNRIYHCYVTPIDSKDPLVLIILSDETLERIQKAQIFQSDKMAAVGRLAAGIAHELRNPLGTVRNSTYILKDFEGHTDEEAVAVQSIERSVSRASEIIESLLKYSRIDDAPSKTVDLCAVLEEVMNYYKKSPDNRKVTFALNCDKGRHIYTNETAIRHIVTNLMGNGIEAMDHSGELSVALVNKDAEIEISITDTGQGIEKEYLNRIFDPFFTTKPVGKGTGLGLYIVYSQIEKIGAAIEVESQVGVGSVFKVRIPV